MSGQGWIKLHRKLIKWEWYNDINVTRLYIHLLLTANWTRGQWRGHSIEVGQRITSIPKLAEETGLTEKQVRLALEKLKKAQNITTYRADGGTLINVENYTMYQGCDEEEGRTRAEKGQMIGQKKGRQQGGKKADEKELENVEISTDLDDAIVHEGRQRADNRAEEGQTTGQKKGNNIRIKNKEEKKKEIYIFFNDIWSLYPIKKGKASVSLTQMQKLYSIGIEEMTRAISRYLEENKDTDKKYLKHGSTFFNKGYIDYLDSNYDNTVTNNANKYEYLEEDSL